mgnify:CR=1 FL=1
MNILAVDTAGKTAGVALLQDDRLLYEVYLDGGMTHSETLMPMIDSCLKMCGLTCADIDLYAVNAGPGSFTGLRIGLAAVKGLAFPRETLCAPVSTLEALAAAHTGEGTVLCALDARRAQVYSAAFDLATHTRLLDDDARAVTDLADFVENFKKTGITYPYMIFSLTDETFSLLCDLKVPEGMREERVSFYISLLDHCYWILGSCVGELAGRVLPIDTTGIDFSMTALFTVIVVNQWMDTKEHKPAVIGGVVGVLCLLVLGADTFLLPALTIAAIILLGVKKKCYIPSQS